MIYALAVYIIIREIMHYIERRDLYSRIMAKDLREYQSTKKDKPRSIRNTIYKNRG